MSDNIAVKIEFLENELREIISFESEDFDKWYKPGFNGIIALFALLFISPIIVIQIPFLIAFNLKNSIIARRNNLPFKKATLILPATKKVDLIDNKIKIEIRHNEHPPPHFHVIIDNYDSSYSISDGSILYGNIPSKYNKRISRWYKKNYRLLVNVWNSTRPDNCSVGKIINKN